MITHAEAPGRMPIQPMSSGYYWFQDPYGSPPEIVDVDVEEGFVHFIARDSPLYLPGSAPRNQLIASRSVPTMGRCALRLH
ncbi:hypothetical protein CFBP6600_44980 (plasmid) [Xanthomonas arboricola pv. corylina]|nr:hypothetical protein CFBP6600_44980 [Xanthomonas arboricola pv. corylina]CAE6869021.1 hypothetical protein CFBP6600_44980 [Xanthomonas arboricola pv. corylina]